MEECLVACSENFERMNGSVFNLSVGPEVFISTSILKYEKNDSKLAPILGAGKRLPKWESAPLLLQK